MPKVFGAHGVNPHLTKGAFMVPARKEMGRDQRSEFAGLRAEEGASAPGHERMPGAPAAWVSVEKREGVVHARYAGRMTLEMIEKAAGRIRELLPPDAKGRILYDTRTMDEPDRELTRWMLQFDEEMRPRIEKAATVAPNMLVEAQARAAFVNSPEHQFFHELQPALQWLKL
jgi:hypothetical protein